MSLEGWVGIGIPDEIAEQAIEWVILLDSEQASLEEEVEFYDWLDEDYIHRWAFEELSEFWARSQLSKAHIALLESDFILSLDEHSSLIHNEQHPPKKYPLYEISAIVFIVIGLAIGIIF